VKGSTWFALILVGVFWLLASWAIYLTTTASDLPPTDPAQRTQWWSCTGQIIDNPNPPTCLTEKGQQR
jgi:hypothetical protein